MTDCERDAEGKVVDPISYDQVPEERVISFEQFGMTFCFDIDVLAKAARKSGKYENPINRQHLPESVVNQIDDYNARIAISVYPKHAVTGKSAVFKIYPSDSIGELIIEAHMNMWTHEQMGLNDQMVTKDDGSYIKSLYDYNLTDPVSKMMDDLNLSNQRVLILREVPFFTGDIGLRYNKLYKYANANNIEWVVNFIPEQYKRDPPPEVPPNEIDHKILADFTLYGLDRERKGARIPDEYFISGISRLLEYSKISTKFARSLQNALQNRIKRHKKGTDGYNSWMSLLRKMYYHVVDPYNLSPHVNIESEFYKSRWDI